MQPEANGGSYSMKSRYPWAVYGRDDHGAPHGSYVIARVLRSRRLYCSIALATLMACKDWRETVVPGLAVAEPSQRAITAEAIPVPGHPEFTLTARAEYQTKAWAIAVDDGVDDDWSIVVPLDVSLAWGAVANPEVLRHFSFHLKRRYISLGWDADMPLSKNEVMHHASNHHLIPGSAEVMQSLKQIRPGDFVELEGQLVDVRGPPGLMRTSLSRRDVGNGACEILYVRSVQVQRPE